MIKIKKKNKNCQMLIVYDIQANEQNFHDYGPHVLHMPKISWRLNYL
jgi:hypothetical protein